MTIGKQITLHDLDDLVRLFPETIWLLNRQGRCYIACGELMDDAMKGGKLSQWRNWIVTKEINELQ